MKFEEALAAMREGKKIRLSTWCQGEFFNSLSPILYESIMSDKWEIIEEPKWQPEDGHWYVNSLGAINTHCGLRKEVSNFGMTRQTREQAEKARDKMRVFNRLLAYVDEHAPDYVWEEGEPNWHVYYNCCHNKFSVGYNDFCKNISTVYMPKEVAEKLVDDLNSGRVEL